MNTEISKYLNISHSLYLLLVLLHRELLWSLKICSNPDFWSWRTAVADFWEPGRKAWKCQCPKPELRWSDFPRSREHSGGMSSGSTTWCMHGVEDPVSSRNHSLMDSVYETHVLGRYFPEAWAPHYCSASREETTQVLMGVSLFRPCEANI